MNLRRAECGHWIPDDVPPAGEHVGSGHSPVPVYLCDDCLERVKRHGPRIETKAVQPVVETVGTPVDLDAIFGPDLPVADQTLTREAGSPAYLGGLYAAHDGQGEDACPYDRRTKEGKDWLRGYREAKSGEAASHSG